MLEVTGAPEHIGSIDNGNRLLADGFGQAPAVVRMEGWRQWLVTHGSNYTPESPRCSLTMAALAGPIAAAISSTVAALTPRTEPNRLMSCLRVAGPTPGMSSSRLLTWRLPRSSDW